MGHVVPRMRITNFAIFDWNRRLSRKQYEIGHGSHGTLIGSHRRRIDPCRFRWPWVTSNPGFKVKYSYKSNISKTDLRDRVTIEHQVETVFLSNGTIFNDLELPLTGFQGHDKSTIAG